MPHNTYHVFTNCRVNHSRGILVPQIVYNPATPPFPKLPDITFAQGQHCGVSLLSALGCHQAILADGETRPVMTTTSTKIKIRILWPGYQEFSKDINVREHTRAGDPIPKWKLAFCVAQVVQAFYTGAVLSGNPEDWSIHRIPFGSLRLLELRHVSTGSWQPVLIYEP
ncbi:hypothetical protein BDY19DRAFT_929405 [Irpex rosettiformis]|uniref:Uncharacterized protein n=1 Tax=Irpex rosettiformis TaxID=378272 RepID=A0ACB8UDA3_9APHY|nr:hypothetical protein BDY19DRAFT_929405 [Irpex rosettiformis]